MSGVKPRELIEVVKRYPVLYDQTTEQYRNVEIRDEVWKRVAKDLNIEGQEEECKRKWNGLRDSLRRARQKRKKSGQTTPNAKYKYEAVLGFLIPHLADRKGKVPDDEDDQDSPETGSTQHSIQETLPDVSSPEEPEERATPAGRVSVEMKPSSRGLKRKFPSTEDTPQDSPSAQLMAYILAEKEAEKINKPKSANQNTETHPVDAFLAGIAISLKSLDPVRLLAAKGKIFNVVQEYELQQLRVDSQLRNSMAYTFPATSSTSVTQPEDGQYADLLDGHPHFPRYGPAIKKSPSEQSLVTEDETFQ